MGQTVGLYAGFNGEPITGQVHSADASSGVAVPVYPQGSVTALTLKTTEYLEVHSVEVVAAASGDVHVFFGTSASPTTGKTIVRGTTGTNGGVVRSVMLHTGVVGDTIWVLAPAGACDVVLNGAKRKERDSQYPNWQASRVPGQ